MARLALPSGVRNNYSGVVAVEPFSKPLSDMHVHVLDQENSSGLLALVLTRGITGIRQMSGSPELLEQRRDGTLPKVKWAEIAFSGHFDVRKIRGLFLVNQ